MKVSPDLRRSAPYSPSSLTTPRSTPTQQHIVQAPRTDEKPRGSDRIRGAFSKQLVT